MEEGIAMMESIGYKFDENGMLSSETPLSFTYLVNTPAATLTWPLPSRPIWLLLASTCRSPRWSGTCS